MHDVAHAALPVAVALLILAGAARGALRLKTDDELTRIAREYVEPLASWGLIALMTYTLALVAAGEGSAASLLVALVLGAAGVFVLVTGEHDEEKEARPAPQEPAPPPPPTPPSTDGSLWARSYGDH